MIARLLGGPADGHTIAVPGEFRTVTIPVCDADGLSAAEYREHRELGLPWFAYWSSRAIARPDIPDA